MSSFEVVGIPPTVKLAVQCLRKGGVVDPGGQSHAHGRAARLQAVVTRELSLIRLLRFERRIPGLPGHDGARCDRRGRVDQCGRTAVGRGLLVPPPVWRRAGPDESYAGSVAAGSAEGRTDHARQGRREGMEQTAAMAEPVATKRPRGLGERSFRWLFPAPAVACCC